jgi:hypothetical protein
MLKILAFFINCIMYPVIFTICYVVYYIGYMFMTFELPIDMNYVKLYKNERGKGLALGDTAYALSAFILCIAFAALILILFYNKTHHI